MTQLLMQGFSGHIEIDRKSPRLLAENTWYNIGVGGISPLQQAKQKGDRRKKRRKKVRMRHLWQKGGASCVRGLLKAYKAQTSLTRAHAEKLRQASNCGAWISAHRNTAKVAKIITSLLHIAQVTAVSPS